MKRRKISRDDIHSLRSFFKKLFSQKEDAFSVRVEELAKEFPSDTVKQVASFVKAESSRSFCHPKGGVIAAK